MHQQVSLIRLLFFAFLQHLYKNIYIWVEHTENSFRSCWCIPLNCSFCILHKLVPHSFLNYWQCTNTKRNNVVCHESCFGHILNSLFTLSFFHSHSSPFSSSTSMRLYLVRNVNKYFISSTLNCMVWYGLRTCQEYAHTNSTNIH